MKSAGTHVIIDGILSPESIPIVSSREHMSQYLEDITKITGMTLVFPPIAMKFPFAGETHRFLNNLQQEGTTSPVIREFTEHIHNRDTQGSGVSAISMWLESHCTLHSWPEENYISIDLFSCKNFDTPPVIDYTMDFMKLKESNIITVYRQMDGAAKIERSCKCPLSI